MGDAGLRRRAFGGVQGTVSSQRELQVDMPLCHRDGVEHEEVVQGALHHAPLRVRQARHHQLRQRDGLGNKGAARGAGGAASETR